MIKTEIKQNSQPKANSQQINVQKPQQHVQIHEIKSSPNSLQKSIKIISPKQSIVQSNSEKPHIKIRKRIPFHHEFQRNIVKNEVNPERYEEEKEQFVIKKVIPNEDGKKMLKEISEIYTEKPREDDVEQFKEVYGGGKYFIINKKTNKTEDIIEIEKEETENSEEDFCSECGRELIDDILRVCKFCGNMYCEKCEKNHECEDSFVCYYCRKRKEISGLGVFADYCREVFCSPKCLENCFIETKCDGCDAEELCDEDIPITCEECGCEFTISEDEEDNIICPECETELEIEE